MPADPKTPICPGGSGMGRWAGQSAFALFSLASLSSGAFLGESRITKSRHNAEKGRAGGRNPIPRKEGERVCAAHRGAWNRNAREKA